MLSSTLSVNWRDESSFEFRHSLHSKETLIVLSLIWAGPSLAKIFRDRSDIHPHTHATNVAYRPKAAGKLSQGQLTRLRITAFMVIPGFLDTDTPQRNTQSLRRHPRLSIKLGAF